MRRRYGRPQVVGADPWQDVGGHGRFKTRGAREASERSKKISPLCLTRQSTGGGSSFPAAPNSVVTADIAWTRSEMTARQSKIAGDHAGTKGARCSG
jgi:hypothetical protein